MKDTFEVMYPLKANLKLSYINKEGMLFQIVPLISLEMDANQIKAELKVAHMKLSETVNEWNTKHLDKQRVKDAMDKWTRIETHIGFGFPMIIKDAFMKELGLDK